MVPPIFGRAFTKIKESEMTGFQRSVMGVECRYSAGGVSKVPSVSGGGSRY